MLYMYRRCRERVIPEVEHQPEKGQLVTLPRFCVHHHVRVKVSERPCSLDSARNSLALVRNSLFRGTTCYGIDKPRVGHGARNMRFVAATRCSGAQFDISARVQAAGQDTGPGRAQEANPACYSTAAS